MALNVSELIRRAESASLGLGLEQTSLAGRLLLATPGRYRIDFETDRAPKSQSIVCDGQRLWTVYADRVSVKDARPVPWAFLSSRTCRGCSMGIR
jgi:hypothetical protein